MREKSILKRRGFKLINITLYNLVQCDSKLLVELESIMYLLGVELKIPFCFVNPVLEKGNHDNRGTGVIEDREMIWTK